MYPREASRKINRKLSELLREGVRPSSTLQMMNFFRRGRN